MGIAIVGFCHPNIPLLPFIHLPLSVREKKKCQGIWESETSIHVPFGHCSDDLGEATTIKVSSVKSAELYKIALIHANTY